MWFVDNIDEVYSELKGKDVEIADTIKDPSIWITRQRSQK